jgi:hypothetical protein
MRRTQQGEEPYRVTKIGKCLALVRVVLQEQNLGFQVSGFGHEKASGKSFISGASYTVSGQQERK